MGKQDSQDTELGLSGPRLSPRGVATYFSRTPWQCVPILVFPDPMTNDVLPKVLLYPAGYSAGPMTNDFFGAPRGILSRIKAFDNVPTCRYNCR